MSLSWESVVFQLGGGGTNIPVGVWQSISLCACDTQHNYPQKIHQLFSLTIGECRKRHFIDMSLRIRTGYGNTQTLTSSINSSILYEYEREEAEFELFISTT